MLCHQCGTPVSAKETTCPNCGTALKKRKRRRTSLPSGEGLERLTRQLRPVSSDDLHLLDAGELIGERFRIDGYLDRGPLGQVYLADDAEEGDARVVLKIFHTDLSEDHPETSERLGEALVTVKAQSERHLAQVLEGGIHKESVWVAMEHLDGLTLRKLMRLRASKEEAFTLEEIERLVRQVTYALQGLGQHAHGALKPENIFFLPEHLKVTDSYLFASLSTEQVCRRLQGSAYVAPELLTGAAKLPERAADVYSLGRIVSEMAFGAPKPPEDADLPGSMRALAEICAKASARAPEERFGSAEAFGEEVQTILDMRERLDSAPKPPAPPVAPPAPPVPPIAPGAKKPALPSAPPPKPPRRKRRSTVPDTPAIRGTGATRDQTNPNAKLPVPPPPASAKKPPQDDVLDAADVAVDAGVDAEVDADVVVAEEVEEVTPKRTSAGKKRRSGSSKKRRSGSSKKRSSSGARKTPPPAPAEEAEEADAAAVEEAVEVAEEDGAAKKRAAGKKSTTRGKAKKPSPVLEEVDDLDDSDDALDVAATIELDRSKRKRRESGKEKGEEQGDLLPTTEFERDGRIPAPRKPELRSGAAGGARKKEEDDRGGVPIWMYAAGIGVLVLIIGAFATSGKQGKGGKNGTSGATNNTVAAGTASQTAGATNNTTAKAGANTSTSGTTSGGHDEAKRMHLVAAYDRVTIKAHRAHEEATRAMQAAASATPAKPETSKPTTTRPVSKPVTSKPSTPSVKPAVASSSRPTTTKPTSSVGASSRPTTSKPSTTKPTTSKPSRVSKKTGTSCPRGTALVRSSKSGNVCVDRYEFPGRGSKPKVRISWFDAKKICSAQGKRLCTISELRRACGSRYPYGSKFNPARCNTADEDGFERELAKAGSKPRCRSRSGAYDLSGNVFEWTMEKRIFGGSFNSEAKAASCRYSSRKGATSKSSDIGVRCCADPR